jgi:hypothetical protein
MNHVMRSTALLFLLSAQARAQVTTEWRAYGRDPGGSRYSPLTQVTRDNVNRLTTAWTYHTGETGAAPQRGAPPALETTPIMVEGTLYISTPLGRVIALDPVSGTERWKFDSQVNRNGGYGDFTNRGVATVERHAGDGRVAVQAQDPYRDDRRPPHRHRRRERNAVRHVRRQRLDRPSTGPEDRAFRILGVRTDIPASGGE